jgi:hypothetical protein
MCGGGWTNILEDPMTDDSLTYTLIVKAESDQQALAAFDANAHIATSTWDVATVPGRPHRVLTMEFDFGDGSEWGSDVEAFRMPVEQRLNEWLIRDKTEWRADAGFPPGSLLAWQRGSRPGR